MHLNTDRHDSELVRSKANLTGGDLLFLISCSEIITSKERAKYSESLVIHASDLPLGRGWSPHIWEISSGATQITLTLLEAGDNVDSGRIWKKLELPIAKDLLWYEINDLLFNAEIQLIEFAVNVCKSIVPVEQDQNLEPTYHRKRTPADSEINVKKSLESQFDLLRICDPERFPAYFKIHGKKYKLMVEKFDD
ncbi:formyltransferase family protein [Pseudidiomarina gelatinasegens]|uniref:formyltransferase family protein n=1 Tax=Pseudidiomarina gelatinasegens TaxID=2487740 RepID=UPI003A96E152